MSTQLGAPLPSVRVGRHDMASRRARERVNARPWEAGEMPEPDDHQHAGDFPARDDDEQPERCPNTDDIKRD